MRTQVLKTSGFEDFADLAYTVNRASKHLDQFDGWWQELNGNQDELPKLISSSAPDGFYQLADFLTQGFSDGLARMTAIITYYDVPLLVTDITFHFGPGEFDFVDITLQDDSLYHDAEYWRYASKILFSDYSLCSLPLALREKLCFESIVRREEGDDTLYDYISSLLSMSREDSMNPKTPEGFFESYEPFDMRSSIEAYRVGVPFEDIFA